MSFLIKYVNVLYKIFFTFLKSFGSVTYTSGSRPSFMYTSGYLLGTETLHNNGWMVDGRDSGVEESLTAGVWLLLLQMQIRLLPPA